MARYRYHASHPFMSTARQTAVDRERKYLANNAYRFDGDDYLAAHLRKRARVRMHTIVREQQYLKRYPRISKYMPRKLLRKPQYKGFGKYIKRLSDGRRLFQFGVKR